MKNNYPKEVPRKGRVRICLELINNVNLKDEVLVDVGCSFGWLEKEVVKFDPEKIIGIDPDKNALAFAQKSVPNAEFLEGSAINIPILDSTADVVILFDVIEHVSKNKELVVLKEISRILKRDGILLFSTPNANFWSNLFDIAWYFGHRHYSEEHIRNFMSKSGFKVTKLIKRGSLLSSLYLTWFYIAKKVLKLTQPRSAFFEKLDDDGYRKEGITDIFLVAVKE